MTSVSRTVLSVSLVMTIASAIAAYWAHGEMQRVMHAPLGVTSPDLVTVVRGDNAASLGRRFEARGWLADYRWFLAHARLTKVDALIQAGTYEINSGDSLADLLTRMVNGDTKQFTVTFIEGTRFSDMRRTLAAAPYLTHELPELSDAAIASRLALPTPQPEGWFFPSTYRYEAYSTDIDILRRAHHRLRAELELAWSERAADLPYKVPYEALIMASIVEKETGQAAERPSIAGVFVRRLKIGMKMQTDPTVIYGLGDAFDGNLRKADLKRDTPYNTYTRGGLPPTPIALAGRAAIEAALNPAPGSALYFVARGDGTHQFSDSLRQHNRAVRQYQLNR